MYKVLTFLSNQIASMEPALNELKGFRIVHVWSIDQRLVVIMEQEPKRGRPTSKDTTEE